MLVNNTRTDYNSDDSTELIYAIGFAYSTPSEVQVRTTDEDGLFYRIYNWEFLGSDQIRFTSTPPATFEIYRETDLSRGYGVSKYNVFNSGSVISANDLNGNFELLRSAIEENQNLLSDLLFEGGEGVYDNRYILRNGDSNVGDIGFGDTGTTIRGAGASVFIRSDIEKGDIKSWINGFAGADNLLAFACADSTTAALADAKIQLRADGDATFAGNITSGDGLKGSDTAGARLLSSGRVQIHSLSSDSDDKQIFQAYKGGSTTPDAFINADGAAGFTGAVTVGSTSLTGTVFKVYGSGTGEGTYNIASYSEEGTRFSVSRNGSVGIGGLGNAAPIYLQASGNAAFAGGVEVNKDLRNTKSSSYWSGTSGIYYIGFDNSIPGNSGIVLNPDGSATFTGQLRGAGLRSNNIYLNENGVVTDGNDALRCYASDGTTLNVRIRPNGSATFAGNVQSGGNPDNGGATGMRGLPGGSIQVAAPNNSSSLWRGYKTGTTDPTSFINADGSAEFSGNITAGNVSFNLEPDNVSYYTTTTDADGNETSVYNGPTLDVKERLLETVNFRTQMRETFQELQVAVEAATDFGELKAAMLVALEDYR